jgi:hypothetical protein
MVNVIQELININHHIVSCSTFELRELASPISEAITEIRINSHIARENNLTT